MAHDCRRRKQAPEASSMINIQQTAATNGARGKWYRVHKINTHDNSECHVHQQQQRGPNSQSDGHQGRENSGHINTAFIPSATTVIYHTAALLRFRLRHLPQLRSQQQRLQHSRLHRAALATPSQRLLITASTSLSTSPIV